MQFSTLSTVLSDIESISSRTDITKELADFYTQIAAQAPNEIEPASYLMLGRIVPAYKSLEFNLSSKLIIRALARAAAALNDSQQEDLFGNTVAVGDRVDAVEQRFKELGDLGDLAQDILQEKEGYDDLTIQEVFTKLTQIAEYSGEGSQERKLTSLTELLHAVTPLSAKYIVRIIIGKLRLGFSEKTLFDALSWACTGGKDDSKQLRKAYQKKADIGLLASTYLTADDEAARAQVLDDYSVETGIPVLPALCQRLETMQDVVDKMGSVIAEPKYDGLRLQIHVHAADAEAVQAGKQPRVQGFTRNLEDVTEMFPELQQIPELMTVEEAIFDAEVIGFDPETNQLLPFQKTITRRRKHDVAEKASETPVRFYLFDLIAYDGAVLLDTPLQERRNALTEILPEKAQPTEQEALDIPAAQELAIITPYILSDDPAELQRYHNQQLAEDLEGVVVKRADSVYRGGRRGWRWVKLKEAEGKKGKLKDTLDLVVLGYYKGQGKRSQFGIGAFLAGVLGGPDDAHDAEHLTTIAKIGTGLTDDQFRELKRRCDEIAVDSAPSNFHVPRDLAPDVWVTHDLVVEIVADEITRSPLHTAGVALRFPRLERFRDDKEWNQATTYQELAGISQRDFQEIIAKDD